MKQNTVLSRIWTWVINFISYDNNCDTKYASTFLYNVKVSWVGGVFFLFLDFLLGFLLIFSFVFDFIQSLVFIYPKCKKNWLVT